MRIKLKAYVGRGNVSRIRLLIDGETIPPNVATRVVLRFGGHCLDTDNSEHPIQLVDDATRVEAKLGLVEGITPTEGDCPLLGTLTVYDAATAEGIAWYRVTAHVYAWPVCAEA